jgi:hypothetical protein
MHNFTTETIRKGQRGLSEQTEKSMGKVVNASNLGMGDTTTVSTMFSNGSTRIEAEFNSPWRAKRRCLPGRDSAAANPSALLIGSPSSRTTGA